jgi:hypothetical protein
MISHCGIWRPGMTSPGTDGRFIAGLLAMFDLGFAAAITIMYMVMFLPAFCAQAGHRIRVAAWVVWFYPVLFLAFLYVPYLVAWSVFESTAAGLSRRSRVHPYRPFLRLSRKGSLFS